MVAGTGTGLLEVGANELPGTSTAHFVASRSN